MRLHDPLIPHAFFQGLSALGVSPSEAVKDPVLAMRHAACCASLADAEGFLQAVLISEPPQLEMMQEDEWRLLVCGVLARVLDIGRRARRSGHVAGGDGVRILDHVEV